MIKALSFLNLLDADNNISLTNVAVWIGIVKMALTAHFSGMDAVGLISALANYCHKRTVINDAKA